MTGRWHLIRRLGRAITPCLALFGLLACQSSTLTRGPVQNPTQAANTSIQVTATADPVYAALQGVKAQAFSTARTESGVRYTNNVANQPNPVVAALQALRDCEEARAARTTPSSSCELRRKGDVVIPSTAEMNEGLAPDRPALLWRLSTNPSTPENGNVYIAGSIHVLKPTMQAPPSYTQALNATQNLVFEIDEDKLSQAEMQALVERYGRLPEEQTLTDLLTASEYRRLITYTTDLGVPEAALRTMKPAMVLLQLGVLEYIALGYLSEHGVESVFRSKFEANPRANALTNSSGKTDAKEIKGKILALETVEQQLAAATALPLALQSELLIETLDEIDNTSSDISNLVQAWLAGDEQRLDRLFNDNNPTVARSSAAQQWLDNLLIKRNVGMATGVTELLQRNDTYLVLVGAAHLVGPNSVIDLLRKQGVIATRLQQNSLEHAPDL